MKILHYIPSIDASSGGVGSYMQLLSRDLGKLCDLHIATHKSNDMLQLENCTIHFLHDGLCNFFAFKHEFIALLKKISPDIFHSNCCWYPYSAFTIGWAQQKGYKTIVTPHGMLEPWILQRNYWSKKLPGIILYQRRAIKKADLVHATAESEKENLLKLGWNPNVKVIPNCVQIDKIQIKTFGVQSRTILFLSRIHPKKGIEILIESVRKLKQQLSDWKVLIAGTGDSCYISRLQEMSSQMCVDDLVEFVGPVYGEKKYDLYRKADLFVLPTYSENFGIVVAEALACGTPVVTTEGAPWKDLVDFCCGWWCEANITSFSSSMIDFLSKTPDQLKQMGINGRQLIESKYSSAKVAQMFLELYHDLHHE